MFPRYRFNSFVSPNPATIKEIREQGEHQAREKISQSKSNDNPVVRIESSNVGEDITPRTYKQQLTLIHYYPDDQTTWFQYFRRPFYLFAFPNIVLAGIQFAFGCTAGIVSFNTISEIMTDAPYNWSAGSTGLIFLAALVGNFIG